MRLREKKGKNKNYEEESDDERNPIENLQKWDTIEDLSNDDTVIHESTPLKAIKQNDFRKFENTKQIQL